jgi:hypothetical protein
MGTDSRVLTEALKAAKPINRFRWVFGILRNGSLIKRAVRNLDAAEARIPSASVGRWALLRAVSLPAVIHLVLYR